MTHPSPQAFIFDMDGTLVDNMGVHGKVWAETFARQGVTIDPAEFNRRTAGRTNPEIFRMILERELSDQEIAELAEQKETLYRERYQPVMKPVDGLIPFLDQAEALGVKMAVATSAPKGNIDLVLHGLDLAKYFDAVVGSADISRGKPDPEIFLTSARRLDVDTQNCIVFEDAPAGIEAACHAGMRTVVIMTTLDPHEIEGQPRVIAVAKDFTSLDVKALIGG